MRETLFTVKHLSLESRLLFQPPSIRLNIHAYHIYMIHANAICGDFCVLVGKTCVCVCVFLNMTVIKYPKGVMVDMCALIMWSERDKGCGMRRRNRTTCVVMVEQVRVNL